jgi:hypothetical protein
MHKNVLILAACMLASVGFAAMDDKDFSLSASTGQTKTNSYVLRGVLHGIYVNAPDNSTGAVVVATANETLFSRSITADGMYRPRVSTHTTAGAAATFNAYSNTAATASAQFAQTWYDKAAMAGLVTVTVAETGIGTNWVVTLIYDK